MATTRMSETRTELTHLHCGFVPMHSWYEIKRSSPTQSMLNNPLNCESARARRVAQRDELKTLATLPAVKKGSL